jgi:AhpD family alkylhydroperoxidase
MELDNRIKALIAVGASVAANCQPCLQTTVAMAHESGANEQEIAVAIAVGKNIRRGAASKMDKFASDLNRSVPAPSPANDGGCGCDSVTIETMEGKK